MPKPKSDQTRRAPAKRNLGVAVYDSVMSLLSIEAISSEGDLAAVVERRLPTRSLKALVKAGLHEKSLYDLVIPRRTLEHREEARPSLLTRDESDKAVRIARVIALADSVFGDNQKAWAWLRDPDQFDGKSPLEKSSTTAGARQVEERLYQLYYGMFG
jgi:putative toxin-antitoxin system antitoxin component (TIGR02293 family)